MPSPRWKLESVWMAFACCGVALCEAADMAPLRPRVEVEETVYTNTPANNGAGPMWCSGSTTLVRVGDVVYATGLETIPNEAPLNNCRWTLFRRAAEGWTRIHTDTTGKTREPSPLITLGEGRVVVSANPTLAQGPTPNGGPARPELWTFSTAEPGAQPTRELPLWDGAPKFSEHSYRSFSADAANGECILFQNIDYTHAEWAFRDRTGKWGAHNRLNWPWGADYEKPQPIRVCYPNVVLRDRAVHFLGVSDIQEPNPAWREFKHQLTGQHWDYDFRRLFYTWTPDITAKPFSAWVEIASREKTCGWVSPCDLWVDPRGNVHLLWTERALDERLRERFFPGQEQSHGLYYSSIQNGKLMGRWTVAESRDSKPGVMGSAGRFQVTPDNRLFIVFYASGTESTGKTISENRVVEVLPEGSFGTFMTIPLSSPFTSYFTATSRAGSKPSRTLDIFGLKSGAGQVLSYARVQLY